MSGRLCEGMIDGLFSGCCLLSYPLFFQVTLEVKLKNFGRCMHACTMHNDNYAFFIIHLHVHTGLPFTLGNLGQRNSSEVQIVTLERKVKCLLNSRFAKIQMPLILQVIEWVEHFLELPLEGHHRKKITPYVHIMFPIKSDSLVASSGLVVKVDIFINLYSTFEYSTFARNRKKR